MHLPLALVFAVVVLGLVRIIGYHWKQGSALIGGALLLAAGLRALLSDEQAGLLAIRGRSVDVLCYTAFGMLILFVAYAIR